MCQALGCQGNKVSVNVGGKDCVRIIWFVRVRGERFEGAACSFEGAAPSCAIPVDLKVKVRGVLENRSDKSCAQGNKSANACLEAIGFKAFSE
jgi:hypothetical protein